MLSKGISCELIKRSSRFLQFSRTLSNHAIHLQSEYPELYQLVHPSYQKICSEDGMEVTSTVSWKCPNGEDHEWEMSIGEAIRLFKRNKHHSICWIELLSCSCLSILLRK